MVVNDNAGEPGKHGALESIAGKPAPTGIAPAMVVYEHAGKPDKRGVLARPLVGAGLLAMVVNDNACKPGKRGALVSIAGKPAPTGIALTGGFRD
jgi:hypothetical protein